MFNPDYDSSIRILLWKGYSNLSFDNLHALPNQEVLHLIYVCSTDETNHGEIICDYLSQFNDAYVIPQLTIHGIETAKNFASVLGFLWKASVDKWDSK